MIYLDRKSKAYAQFLKAHKQRLPKYIREMPRQFLERELSEIMLADKEAHSGEDLGAKPKKISFWKITDARPEDLPANDAAPWRGNRERSDYVQDEARKCVTLWRAVLEQQAYDLLKMWGASKEDHRSAVMFFESNAERWREAREGVCAMALIGAADLSRAHRSGRLRGLAENAIGRERWQTRQVNAQATAQQPDLFYSRGIR